MTLTARDSIKDDRGIVFRILTPFDLRGLACTSENAFNPYNTDTTENVFRMKPIH